jgi:septation ring formation regulator EzrA
VSHYYKEHDKFEAIHGIGTVDEIFKALYTLIEAEMTAQQSIQERTA